MNLLPKEQKDDLGRGLKNRFVVVLLILVSISFVVGLVMLFPAYLLTPDRLSESESNLSSLQETDSTSKEILKLPEEISFKLNFAQLNGKKVSPTDVVSKISGLLPQDLTVNSILFSREQPRGDKNGTLIAISGKASTRDSLVSFSAKLENSGYFSSVDMPVSNLTKDRDLPFNIDIFIQD